MRELLEKEWLYTFSGAGINDSVDAASRVLVDVTQADKACAGGTSIEAAHGRFIVPKDSVAVSSRTSDILVVGSYPDGKDILKLAPFNAVDEQTTGTNRQLVHRQHSDLRER